MDDKKTELMYVRCIPHSSKLLENTFNISIRYTDRNK